MLGFVIDGKLINAVVSDTSSTFQAELLKTTTTFEEFCLASEQMSSNSVSSRQ